MGLRDIVIQTKTITAGAATFEVRGLSMNDLMMVVTEYGPQMTLVFNRLQQGDIQGDDIKGTIVNMSREFPDLLAAVICLAADEYDPEMVAKMKKVPLGVTTEAAEEIFKLTFTSEAEVKKFIESLSRMIAAGSGALTQALGPTSPTGTGVSVAA